MRPKFHCYLRSLYFAPLLILAGCVHSSFLNSPKDIARRLTQCDAKLYIQHSMPIWPFFPIVMYLDKSVPPDAVPSIVRAAEDWNRVLGQEVLVLRKRATSFNVSNDDKLNVIFWNLGPKPEDESTLAFAELRFDDARYYEADIYVHTIAIDYSFSDPISDDRFDLESVMVHEFGHVLGLEHTPTGVMVAESESGLNERSIEFWAGEAVKCLYMNGHPKNKEAPGKEKSIRIGDTKVK